MCLTRVLVCPSAWCLAVAALFAGRRSESLCEGVRTRVVVSRLYSCVCGSTVCRQVLPVR